jgi:predicted nuclease of predicted toxin-antitoxin system
LKVLIDACVSRHARDSLVGAGHDVVWAAEWPEAPGDEAILARAHRESRVLVTADKDFGELAVHRGLPHRGIVRLVVMRARDQGPVCVEILARHGELLAAGGIVTAERGRLRVREGRPT